MGMIQTEYYCWLQRDASINAVNKKKSLDYYVYILLMVIIYRMQKVNIN